MKLTKKIAIIMALALCIQGFTACGSKPVNTEDKKAEVTITDSDNKQEDKTETADTAQSDAADADTSAADSAQVDPNGTHKVVDHAGNEVEVPNTIDAIVIDQIPILSTYMAYWQGKAPYIVGYAGSLKQTIEGTVLKDIAPELLDASNTVHAQSDINTEEIVKLNPDVIFYNASNKQHYEQLSKTGIPCVGFATVNMKNNADPIERYAQWLRLLEDVFGEKGKMDDFINHGFDMAKSVEDKIATIPEDKRPSAMILWKVAKTTPVISGNGDFGYYWLQRLGVKNVAENSDKFSQTTMEQIYEWNPDILFLDGPGLLPQLTTDIVLNNKYDGMDFSPLKAVENKRVYNTKLGMWNWFTPNSDAPLVLMWLAKNTYPDVFADMDLNTEIKNYYKTYYNYDLTDEQVEDMFKI